MTICVDREEVLKIIQNAKTWENDSHLFEHMEFEIKRLPVVFSTPNIIRNPECDFIGTKNRVEEGE